MKGTGAQSAPAGGNRTGMETSPELARELVEGAAAAAPSSEGGLADITEYRAEYIREGFPVGSLPTLPAGREPEVGVEETQMAVLLDKLSERLAFERMGTRLYEALINKVEVLGESSPGPTLDELWEIHDEELQHFLLIKNAVTSLGGDPTVQSPCADVAAVSSLGILQVLTDPRTTVTQCLQAILTAELTDNAGWELLIELTGEVGYADMAREFETALGHEERHLSNVRGWLTERLMAKV